jgi:hypothetical protein
MFARLKAKTGSVSWPGKQWSTNLLLMFILAVLHRSAVHNWHTEEGQIVDYDERQEERVQIEEEEGDRHIRAPELLNPAAFHPMAPFITMGIIWYLIYNLRQTFRARYQITESEMLKDVETEDIVLTICCPQCVLAQMDRHVSNYSTELDCDVCANSFMPPDEDPAPDLELGGIQ